NGASHFFQLGATAYDEGDVHSVYYGVHYRIPNGGGFFADRAVISVPSQDNGGEMLAGNVLTVKLYEWNDADEDMNAQDTERTIVAIGIYEFTGSEPAPNTTPSTQEVQLLGITAGEAPALKDDTDYILMVEFDSPGDNINMPLAITRDYDYTGNFVLGEQVPEVSANSTFIKTGSTDTEFNFGGLGYRYVPVARLYITTSDPTPVREIAGLNSITLGPNPASDYIQMEITAEEPLGDSHLVLFDANGFAVKYFQVHLGTFDSVQMPLADVPSGQYYLGLKTASGQQFQPVQIIK
ncbi:MAG: hypothetical protein HKN16_00415, partial [Saprospiraceae bacterium]|nr:hypothetical protein [Saprospiraceae bacterium]